MCLGAFYSEVKKKITNPNLSFVWRKISNSHFFSGVVEMTLFMLHIPQGCVVNRLQPFGLIFIFFI